MEKLLLVRHGLSVGNKLGFIQGKTDFKLSKLGEIEVNKLILENNDLFKEYDNIVSSPLSRASETAKIIGNKYNKNITYDNLLEEFDAGILEGIRKTEAQKLYPQYFRVWNDKGDLDMIPGAEKGDYLQARVLMYLEKYLNCSCKEIIVSHAGLLRCLINTVYGRNRTTPILLDHNNIHVLENVWDKISLFECPIAKNSNVYMIETYDQKYVMKKNYKKCIEESVSEKKLLEYLSMSLYTPCIIGLADRNDYVLKMMDYSCGENIHGDLNKEKIANTTKELYVLKELLRDYNDSHEYESVNIIERLNSFLENIDDIDVKRIIVDILENDSFNNCLKNDNIQIVHDDLHRDNILYQNDNPVFLDFEGLSKWPSGYQLASHIAANYLLYDDSFNIELILENWPEKINIEYLKKLILFRLIQGYNYFCGRIKTGNASNDDYELQDKYKKSLKKLAI